MKGRTLELSRRERVAAALVTGPGGRFWSFARESVTIARLVAVQLRKRARERMRLSG